MQILCVSDHVDPLIHSIHVKERFANVDLVLSAGDLPMEYLGYIASSLNKPVLFVFGNHNLKSMRLFKRLPNTDPFNEPLVIDINEHLFGSTHVGGKVVRVKGLLIAGLGGSRRYNGGENQYTDGQMVRRIIRLMPRLWLNKLVHGRYLDILLTHAAPLGIHDQTDPCHVGFAAFLWFMKRFRPQFLLHGHIHLLDQNAERETVFEQTRVINVFSHYVIEIPTRSLD